MLVKMLKALLPTETAVYSNYSHPKLVFPSSRKQVELDIYIPSYQLALEYQGEQHYHSDTKYGLREQYEATDKLKEEVCARAGITLLIVPYFWDSSATSLAAMIQSLRPDISLVPSHPTIQNRLLTATV
jgi:hypothetical protein